MTRTAILHLGGDAARARTTAVVWQQLRDHDPLVILSTEELPGLVLSQIDPSLRAVRVLWHYEAWDTVSQFTLVWPILEARGIRRLVVVTDHYHMRRALRIADQVFVGRGIEVIGVPHLGGDLDKQERLSSIWRDELRALVWAWTGWLWYARDIRAARLPAHARWAAEAARLPGTLIR
jgi:uncharacterized SAM-binding protein YcdF (DUF218 family)